MAPVVRNLKAHSDPGSCRGLAAPHQLRLPRAPSSLAWSTSRDGAPTALGLLIGKASGKALLQDKLYLII